MANRILLGKGTTARGGTDKYGLWISKPTKDVLNCTDDELVFNTDKGGTGDIKALFQLQNANTSASTAVTSVTSSISAGATANVSFSNISFNFGVIAFGRSGLGSGTTASQTAGRFTINSVSGGSINVTNLDSSNARTLEFAILPQHGNAFY